MGAAFDSFVIFAEMRTGSNLLESSLNAVEGIACHGEAFNPHFIGYPKQSALLGLSLAARETDPLALLAAIRKAPGMNGFRYFHDHDHRVLDPVLHDRRCAKIILTRNPVDSYVSLKIARETGQWKLGGAGQRKTAKIRFDAAEFETHAAELQAFQVTLLHELQISGQTAFYLDYDDVQDAEVLNGLLRFLGVAGEIGGPAAGLVKQNPAALEEKVTNLSAMETALARMDRFNLSRTPNFEPRRGPAVPGFVATPGAGLLYLPIRPEPDGRIRDWMGAVDGVGAAGLIGGFTQKTLRQWKRQHPGHRSFAIVRHPLARAHTAFCQTILTGAYADLREILIKRHAVPLPPLHAVAGMDLDAHRAAFAGFLAFVKANLGGQTSLRVDPVWASQLAILTGFAQFVPPDLILREDRLAADLAWLSETLDLPLCPLADGDGAAVDVPFALAEVRDAHIEAAARDAYQRDYIAFGFGPWRG